MLVLVLDSFQTLSVFDGWTDREKTGETKTVITTNSGFTGWFDSPGSWGRLIPGGYGSESGRWSENRSHSLQSLESGKGHLD